MAFDDPSGPARSRRADLIPIVGVATLALAVAGCGSGTKAPRKDAKGGSLAATSTASATATATATSGCRPAPAPGSHAQTGMGRPGAIRVEIGGAPAGLRVLSARSVPSIKAHYVQRRAFMAPAGTTFVAMTYALTNHGAKDIKPSHSVNPRFVLRTPNGKRWLAAEESPGCTGPISASWAASRDVDNPASAIAKGATGTTAVVFLVPVGRGRFVLRLGSNAHASAFRVAAKPSA